ncbi:unnamed protein product, partial [Schistosoma mattheei]
DQSVFDFLNQDQPITDDPFFKTKYCTPNSSYDLLLFLYDLLKLLLNLMKISYLKIYFYKIHFNLIQCLLYLGKCLYYCCCSCSNFDYPSLISQCIFYIIRIIGCICYDHDRDHDRDEIQIRSSFINSIILSNQLFNNFLLLIHWYYQSRCSWSICGIELCWCLTNFIQYFNISLFQQQQQQQQQSNHQMLNHFIDYFLFKVFTLELGTKEVMRLLYISMNNNNNNNSNGICDPDRDYFYWIKILNSLNDHIKSQLIYWKYLKQNLPMCYIETFIGLFKFLSLVNMNDNNKVLQEYIVNNCPILYKLSIICNETLTRMSSLLPSISLELLTMEEIREILYSMNSSTDIISYIMSVLDYI